MGFWGTALYENDCTCDVRDAYTEYLRAMLGEKNTFQDLEVYFKDYLGTDEEPLFWYAIADTQWHFGRLLPEVKDKAMFWLQNDGGITQWEGNVKGERGWKKTMERLHNQLQMPQPREKKIEVSADFQYNPGIVGDLFAYRFHTASSRGMGYYGKYILLQKVGVDENSRGLSCPQFLFFDELFPEIPTVVNVNEMKVLPFDVPERFMPSGKNAVCPQLNMSAILDLTKKKNSPEKHINYIGSFPVHYIMNQPCSSAEFGWDCIENTLLYYHSEWKNYSYQLFCNESFVSRVIDR